MRIRQLLALLLTSLALVSAWAQAPAKPVRKATTTGADMTGLWHVPGETGWGISVVQQNELLLVFVFVYGNDHRPLWLVAPDASLVSADSAGNRVYSGELYRTRGPYFGAATHDSIHEHIEPVGLLGLRFLGVSEARLTYSVDGVTVARNLVPYTFRINNLNGFYAGSSANSYGSPSCGLPLPDTGGPALVGYDFQQSGTSVTIQLVHDVTFANCTLAGEITQKGKLVEIDGSFTCSAGPGGQFSIRRLEAGIDGFSGTYFTRSNPACANAPVTIGASRMP